jgi:hypothetical protein
LATANQSLGDDHQSEGQNAVSHDFQTPFKKANSCRERQVSNELPYSKAVSRLSTDMDADHQTCCL